MDGELCFCIDGKNLYLEQALVEYENIPVFFLCKNGNQYFVVLCTDIEALNYIIVSVKTSDVFQLLHGKIPMRDIFLFQREYWEIISGEEISLDMVKKHVIKELDSSMLPKEGACFKILTEEINAFVQKFDNEFFNAEYVDFSFIQQNIFGKSEFPIESESITKGTRKSIDMYYEISVTMQSIETAKSWKNDGLIFVAA